MKKIKFIYWVLFLIFPFIPILGGLFYAIKALIKGEPNWWQYLILSAVFLFIVIIVVLIRMT